MPKYEISFLNWIQNVKVLTWKGLEQTGIIKVRELNTIVEERVQIIKSSEPIVTAILKI